MSPRQSLVPDSDYTVRDQQRMSAARNYFAWQAALVLPAIGRRPLEVGCGVGNFTALLMDREYVIATDVEPACTARLAERFRAASNLAVHTVDIQSASYAALREHAPDSVVCLNVLEHIEDDALALRNMNAVLPEGGVVALIVPAFASLYGPIDRLLGHYRRYTKRSLTELATRSGFRVDTLRYMNSVGFAGWWVNAHLLRRTEQSEAQIGVFDRYLVPPLRWIESRVPPPFGQSVFAILAKQGAPRP